MSVSLKLIVIAIICLSLSHLARAQIPVNGSCPSFDCCKEKFSPLPAEQFSGIWYLYEAVPFFFDADTKCTRVNVSSLTTNYFYMNATQTEITLNQVRITNGFGNFTEDGRVTTLVSNLRIPIHYEIIQLSPDFIILFSCSECGFFTSEGAGLYIYVYTTMELPPQDVIDSINSKLEQCSIPLDKVVEHDQMSCQTPVKKPILGGGVGC